MHDPKREKAISKVYSLDQLANHPNTPHHEAESARAMATKLRTKYGIGQPRDNTLRDILLKQRQEHEAAARAYEMAKRAAMDAEAKRKAQREAWQREKDRQYPPTTGDPFEDAIRRDGRTAQEKNRDMQDRFRRGTGCSDPESFFDSGGMPRPRNQSAMACEKCGRRLFPGEGAILKVGAQWKAWCCEMKPGPRRKRWS